MKVSKRNGVLYYNGEPIKAGKMMKHSIISYELKSEKTEKKFR